LLRGRDNDHRGRGGEESTAHSRHHSPTKAIWIATVVIIDRSGAATAQSLVEPAQVAQAAWIDDGGASITGKLLAVSC
jgi:hypothetical protein